MFNSIRNKLVRPSAGVSGLSGLGILARRFLPLFSRRSSDPSSLQHLGTLPLTPQCSVALVRIREETLVLGITAQSVTLLTKSSDGTLKDPFASTNGPAETSREAPARCRPTKKGRKSS